MPDEARLLAALLISFVAAALFTRLALRLAARLGFLDHPVGYKAHAAPTAYLGGAAVVGAFMLAAFGAGVDRSLPVTIAGCALALGLLGTIDDRIPVRPQYRVFAEVAGGAVLWSLGLGWSFLVNDLEQLVLTMVWVVAFTSAFNLMDNMDGAGATVGAVCAAGIAVVAVGGSDIAVGVLAVALCGACLGFLPSNLRRNGSAKIFLGDGGSMPIGFVLAALAMNIPSDEGLGWPILLVGGMLLGVLVLDTALVIVSRTRRGVSMLTGGRDHLTHRLGVRLGSPVAVALTLAITQASVSLLAVAALELGRPAILASALTCLAAGAAVIAALERPGWLRSSAGGADASAVTEPVTLIVTRD